MNRIIDMASTLIAWIFVIVGLSIAACVFLPYYFVIELPKEYLKRKLGWT